MWSHSQTLQGTHTYVAAPPSMSACIKAVEQCSSLIKDSNVILSSLPPTRQWAGNCLKRPLGFPHLKCVFMKYTSLTQVKRSMLPANDWKT